MRVPTPRAGLLCSRLAPPGAPPPPRPLRRQRRGGMSGGPNDPDEPKWKVGFGGFPQRAKDPPNLARMRAEDAARRGTGEFKPEDYGYKKHEAKGDDTVRHAVEIFGADAHADPSLLRVSQRARQQQVGDGQAVSVEPGAPGKPDTRPVTERPGHMATFEDIEPEYKDYSDQEEIRKSGAVVRKTDESDVTPTSSADAPGGTEGIWFQQEQPKDARYDMKPYQAMSPQQRGGKFNLSSTFAQEKPDERSLAEFDWWTRKNMLGAMPDLATRTPDEIVAKQQRFREEFKKKKTLEILLGEEEGGMWLRRYEHVVLVEIIPVRGHLTGGMMRQLDELLRQLHGMRDIAGICFYFRGAMGGMPDIEAQLKDQGEAASAAQSAQRIATELLQLPAITVTAFDDRVSGVAAELATATDFRFCTPKGSLRFSQAFSGWAGCLGGALRLSQRLGARSALRVIAGGRSIASDALLEAGLVDRVVPESPENSALNFLSKSFTADTVESVRSQKTLIMNMEIMHMRQVLMMEQNYFRARWGKREHRNAIEFFKVAI